MFVLYQALGTLDMDRINAAFMTGAPAVSASLVGILLFIGASGKSAQIPLHVWLPDAMAGPTPVSALIHAATMVTAGVYLVARMSGIYLHAPEASALIAGIGAATAFFAATIAVVQTDIKKVLAYSTISQLGFMFVALRRRRVRRRGLPPLHARVLQGVPLPRRRQRDPRDERRAGHPQDGRARAQDPGDVRDLRCRDRGDRRHPAARGLLLEGRDPVVRLREQPRGSALCSRRSRRRRSLTSFYMFRLLWLTFFGRSRISPEAEHHIHESPASMTSVLVVLAILSAIGGFLSIPHFLEAQLPLPPIIPALEHYETPLLVVSIVLAFAGLAGAAYVYGGAGGRAERVSARFSTLHRVLSGKYFVDEAYEALIGRPLLWVSDRVFLRIGDRALFDGTLHGFATLGRSAAAGFARIQNGSLHVYALLVLSSRRSAGHGVMLDAVGWDHV
jgi:NADH-quinone oxidoreductase subunit L